MNVAFTPNPKKIGFKAQVFISIGYSIICCTIGLLALIYILPWHLKYKHPQLYHEYVSDGSEHPQLETTCTWSSNYIKVGIWMVGFPSGVFLIRKGRRMHSTLSNFTLENSEKPPVLYLRSFDIDQQDAPSIFHAVFSVHKMALRTEEENLARLFSLVGPFVAIGKPGDELPPLGAHRLYVSHRTWRQTAAELIDKARLIVVRSGLSRGLLWEIEQLVKVADPSRVIIYIPHDESEKDLFTNKSKTHYSLFRNALAKILPNPLPIKRRGARFVIFTSDWHPMLVPCASVCARWTSLYFISGMPYESYVMHKELNRIAPGIGMPYAKSDLLLKIIIVVVLASLCFLIKL